MNEAEWQELLWRAHFVEWDVGHRLIRHGFTVQVPEMPDVTKREVLEEGATKNQKDVLVGRYDPVEVSVKGSTRVFRGPDDYPYNLVHVDGAIAYDAKDPKPIATVIISADGCGAVVVPEGTNIHWVREVTEHSTEGRIAKEYYRCPIAFVTTWAWLIGQLDDLFLAEKRPWV